MQLGLKRKLMQPYKPEVYRWSLDQVFLILDSLNLRVNNLFLLSNGLWRSELRVDLKTDAKFIGFSDDVKLRISLLKCIKKYLKSGLGRKVRIHEPIRRLDMVRRYRDRSKPVTKSRVLRWTSADLVDLVYELGLCLGNCTQQPNHSWRVNLHSYDNETYFNYVDRKTVKSALRAAILTALKEKKQWHHVRHRSFVNVD